MKKSVKKVKISNFRTSTPRRFRLSTGMRLNSLTHVVPFIFRNVPPGQSRLSDAFTLPAASNFGFIFLMQSGPFLTLPIGRYEFVNADTGNRVDGFFVVTGRFPRTVAFRFPRGTYKLKFTNNGNFIMSTRGSIVF